MAETPLRAIRIPDDIWEPAKATAEREGDTLSDVVRQALIRYTTEHTEGTAP